MSGATSGLTSEVSNRSKSYRSTALRLTTYFAKYEVERELTSRKLYHGPNSTSSVSVRSPSWGRCGPLKYLRPRSV